MLGRITISAILLVAFLAVIAIFGTETYPFTSDSESLYAAPLPEMDSLTTETWGLFDVETGDLITGNNTDTVHAIASLTKLFTAYAVERSKNADTTTTIRWSDINTEGRAGKLVYGEVTTPAELLFPLLIESSNDAGEAIRRTIGSDFMTGVDAGKEELRLTNTTIIDPTGLRDENVSTVIELARFYAHLKKTYPHSIDITRLHTYLRGDTGLVNNNPARTRADFSGGKHGYTDTAGRTFVGTFIINELGEEAGVVLLGSKSLLSDINTIVTYAKARGQ